MFNFEIGYCKIQIFRYCDIFKTKKSAHIDFQNELFTQF